MPFSNIFNHSAGRVFILFIVFIAVQNLFSLMYSFILLFPPLPKDTYTTNIAKIHIKECIASVFFQKFYGFRSY